MKILFFPFKQMILFVLFYISEVINSAHIHVQPGIEVKYIFCNFTFINQYFAIKKMVLN